MSTFATTLPALALLMTRLTGLQMVEERDSPQKVVDPQKKGKLQYIVMGCKPVGQDEIRYTYNSGTNTMDVVVLGMRRLTVTARFEGYDHRPGQDALFYLERLGTRMSWPSSVQALQDVGLSLIERTSFINLSRVYEDSDRRWSIGQKDFIFNFLLEEPPGADDTPVSWIQTVIWASDTLDDVDGLPLDRQISGTVVAP